MHYACADCRTKAEARPNARVDIVLRKDLAPMAQLAKVCCFCKQMVAQFRLYTDAPADCPAGHLAAGKLEEIFDRAAAASTEDMRKELAENSPLAGLGLLDVDVDIKK